MNDRSMIDADFDLGALWDALDQQRRERDLTWAAVAREVNRFMTMGRPIAASTMLGLKDRAAGEGDGILQMLLWLGRTPESFVPHFNESGAGRFQLPDVPADRILRWDTAALYAALNAQRTARGLTWSQLAREVGRCTPAMLTNLAKGGRIGFPAVMRLVGWLGQPAARFTWTAPPGRRRA